MVPVVSLVGGIYVYYPSSFLYPYADRHALLAWLTFGLYCEFDPELFPVLFIRRAAGDGHDADP